MSDMPEIKVTQVTLFIRNQSAMLKKTFAPPVSSKEAGEWVDENVMIRFENLEPIKLFEQPTTEG